MDRILPASQDWPLHDVAKSREIELASLSGLAPHTLMRRAGESVAAVARALAPHASTVWLACGPGNNGGDGLEAAIHLQAAGLSVHATLIGDPARLPADAAAALARAQAAEVTIAPMSAPLPSGPDLAIDALLGLGGTRAPSGDIAQAVEHLNALSCPVLAVDLPSGLDANTGQPHGDVCVVADHTLSLLTLKPGLFTGAGRDHAGVVWLDTLGVELPRQSPAAWLSGVPRLASRRQHAQHKGSFGDVAVVGGATGMAGAALLAARAAHAAGAGRVYVEALDGHALALDVLRPELMFRERWSRAASPAALAGATVVAGCGGGEAVKGALPRLLSGAGRLVLDADALNAIAADTTLARLLTARGRGDRETVLTPHPLEAARLLHTSATDIQADRLGAARRLARQYACVVVLKGSGSVVASPDGCTFINSTGNAALATAGTGDVLAGWIGGCWSASAAPALEAARHAVWRHGRAADLCQHTPMRAADLIEAMHGSTSPH
ncbi:MAG: NAD(P)H-hydrate dehydratase [Rhizobacter sp.]|nr:NAD(P)H-hydrate dehydratase [Rhizobacter sp.]